MHSLYIDSTEPLAQKKKETSRDVEESNEMAHDRYSLKISKYIQSMASLRGTKYSNNKPHLKYWVTSWLVVIWLAFIPTLCEFISSMIFIFIISSFLVSLFLFSRNK